MTNSPFAGTSSGDLARNEKIMIKRVGLKLVLRPLKSKMKIFYVHLKDEWQVQQIKSFSLIKLSSCNKILHINITVSKLSFLPMPFCYFYFHFVCQHCIFDAHHVTVCCKGPILPVQGKFVSFAYKCMQKNCQK